MNKLFLKNVRFHVKKIKKITMTKENDFRMDLVI